MTVALLLLEHFLKTSLSGLTQTAVRISSKVDVLLISKLWYDRQAFVLELLKAVWPAKAWVCVFSLQWESRVLPGTALFHTVLSLGVKGGKAQWHLKSAFPSALSICSFFLQTSPYPLLHPFLSHTHTVPNMSQRPIKSPAHQICHIHSSGQNSVPLHWQLVITCVKMID